MKIAYLVNRVSTHKVSKDITVDGEATRQPIDQVEVELVDETTGHGSLTLRFHKPSEMAEALEKYREGETITVDPSPVVEAAA